MNPLDPIASNTGLAEETAVAPGESTQENSLSGPEGMPRSVGIEGVCAQAVIPDIGRQSAADALLSPVQGHDTDAVLPRPFPPMTGGRREVWELLRPRVGGMDRTVYESLTNIHLEEDEWEEIAQGLQSPDSDIAQVIVLALCGGENCRENFKAALPLLALPSTLKPGQYEFWDFITVKGTAQGRELVNVALGLADVAVPENNRLLSSGQIQRLRSICEQVAGVKYSTMGLLMQFVSALQASTKEVAPSTLTKEDIQKAFERYVPKGDLSALRFGYGDCMCSAELVKAVLEDTAFLGSEFRQPITALLAGKLNLILVSQETVKGRVYLQDAPARVWGVTHLDVAIPYSDLEGRSRIMLFSPGLGKIDHIIQDIDIEKQRFESHPALQRAFIAPSGESLDAAEYQKLQFGFRSKVVVNAVPPDGFDEAMPKDQICGIDMLRGTFFLNSGAVKLINPRAEGGFIVPLKVVAEHSEKLATIFNTGPLVSLHQEGMTNAEAFQTLFSLVAKLFTLPSDFPDTLTFFAKIHKAYCQAVLWEDVQPLVQY